MLLSDMRLKYRLLMMVAFLLLSVLLGACGFRPLYGKHVSGNVPAEQYLALTEVEQINDRIGQQLRNNLLNQLNPKGPAEKPLYSLSISISQSINNLGVQKSAVVTRGNLQVSATYGLTKLYAPVTLADGSQSYTSTNLTSGTVLSTSSYDIPQAQYAVRAALKDARTRAVKEIADEIKTRLAVYFKQNADKL